MKTTNLKLMESTILKLMESTNLKLMESTILKLMLYQAYTYKNNELMRNTMKIKCPSPITAFTKAE